MEKEKNILDDVLTTAEIREKWGISDVTLRRLVQEGDFQEGEYRKSGGTLLFLRSAIEKRWGPETAPRKRKPGPKRKSPQE